MSDATAATRARFIGGHLCLDFTNTADWHASDQPVELLPEYADLAAWARAAGTLDDVERAGLQQLAARLPRAAEAARRRAVRLREALYRIFSAHARGREPVASDLQLLNHELAAACQHRRLAQDIGAYAWNWETGEKFERVIWPIACSAAELLTSPELARVRECAGPGCGWLFLDASRNHSRRWCSMESCGNRTKARRHYERTRAPAT
jgi:predicted RNA-binding Zn ribbon-like protein